MARFDDAEEKQNQEADDEPAAKKVIIHLKYDQTDVELFFR